jgi:VWFA-related protein
MRPLYQRSTPQISSIFAVLLLVVTAVSAQSRRVAPTPTPIPPADIERVLTEEVKLNVLAFDENGKFVPDVKESDIVITDNNILHQPTSVRRIPANVLIVMDTGGELRTIKNLDQTRKVARAIVNALRPGDSIAVLQYSDKPEIVTEWTTDKKEALAAINRTKFGRRDAFVDALDMGRNLLMRNPADNRHMVLITDGTDSKPGTSAKFDAFQRLVETDISVHVISYTSMEAADVSPRTKSVRTDNTPSPQALPPEVKQTLPNGTRDVATAPKIGPTIFLDRTLVKRMKARKADLEDSQEKLDKLAENTNGEFILPTSLDEMVDKAPLVASMIDAAYVVTYTPKVPILDRKGLVQRNIEVTSKRDGLIVQARRRLLFDAQ